LCRCEAACFFLGDGNDVDGDPVASDELEDVGWHPVGHEAFASPLFYSAKNARRIGICCEAFSPT
jgi:hypothetical protein